MKIRRIGLVLSFAALGLSACASSQSGRPVNRDPCPPAEALVCYGKNATKVSKDRRPENIDLCRCERVQR